MRHAITWACRKFCRRFRMTDRTPKRIRTISGSENYVFRISLLICSKRSRLSYESISVTLQGQLALNTDLNHSCKPLIHVLLRILTSETQENKLCRTRIWWVSASQFTCDAELLPAA